YQYLSQNPEILQRLKFILVPHDIQQSYIKYMQEQLMKFNYICSDFRNDSLLELKNSDFLILNEIGHLAYAYQYADLAWVGTGKGGVHNVLEPLIFELPTCFQSRNFSNA